MSHRVHGWRTFAVFPLLAVLLAADCCGQDTDSRLEFTISMPEPASATFHVRLDITGVPGDSLTVKMPNWTPGYYALMYYSRDVRNLSAVDGEGNPLEVEQPADNSWRIMHQNNEQIIVEYEVVNNRRLFIANSYLDEERAFIQPTTLLMYVEGMIEHPVTLNLQPPKDWPHVATGLEPVEGEPFAFTAPNFDVLFDSPIQVGTLDSLPTFEVQGVPHHFVGYELGEFDREQFIKQLQRIVQAATDIIGDVPYKHYTFIGIGRGQGGLEHINSTAIPFNGARITKRTLAFIAHEYFHHYNPKRIRPIELGPFDYDDGSPTKMLWVAEGVTVYYQHLILNRAGITSRRELLESLRSTIVGFENTPGRLYQSATEASMLVWEQGQFGGDKQRTINYYQKGPALGLLLDFALRHHSTNEKSLDDVMRLLYSRYYKTLQRGYTEDEFWDACEELAGTDLTEVREYTSTTKPLDYNKYLGYAGLQIKLPQEQSEDPLAPEELKNYFQITEVENPSELQDAILNSWSRK